MHQCKAHMVHKMHEGGDSFLGIVVILILWVWEASCINKWNCREVAWTDIQIFHNV